MSNSELETFLFDINGYLVIEDVLSKDETLELRQLLNEHKLPEMDHNTGLGKIPGGGAGGRQSCTAGVDGGHHHHAGHDSAVPGCLLLEHGGGDRVRAGRGDPADAGGAAGGVLRLLPHPDRQQVHEDILM